jgi:hypothetical protein
MAKINGWVSRVVPMVMVVVTGNVTGAWYQKGLPTRNLAVERHECASRHKSSKEHTTAMSYGNSSRNHKLKLVLVAKAKKSQSF